MTKCYAMYIIIFVTQFIMIFQPSIILVFSTEMQPIYPISKQKCHGISIAIFKSLTRGMVDAPVLRKHRCAKPGLAAGKLVSLNRLSVGCGTTPRRQSGDICRLLFGIRVIYKMLPPHGHCRNIFFINNCKFVFLFILG